MQELFSLDVAEIIAFVKIYCVLYTLTTSTFFCVLHLLILEDSYKQPLFCFQIMILSIFSDLFL